MTQGRFPQRDGLRDIHAGGVAPRLSSERLAEFAAIVEGEPDRDYDDIVDVACGTWNKLIAMLHQIKSIAIRGWAHVGGGG